MASNKVTFDVHEFFEKLRKWYPVKIKGTTQGHLYVQDGVHTDYKTGKTISLHQLALELIAGRANMPARPFFEDFIATHRAWFYRTVKQYMHVTKVRDGGMRTMQVKLDIDALCTDVQFEFTRWIESGYYNAVAPNSPRTIKNKTFGAMHTGEFNPDWSGAVDSLEDGKFDELEGLMGYSNTAPDKPPLIDTHQLLDNIIAEPIDNDGSDFIPTSDGDATATIGA